MAPARFPVGPAVLAGGLALLVVPIVVTLALLPGGGSTATEAAPAPAASQPAASAPHSRAPIVPPPRNAFVLAGESGAYAVGLAVSPGKRLRLTLSVLSGQGRGVDGLRPRATVEADGDARAGLRACGRGCYSAEVATRGAPRRVTVRLAARGAHAAPVEFRLPAAWPPRRASALLRRATATFKRLRSVSVDDTLSGGVGATVVSTWRLEAPDRLSYAIANGGPQAIVIGGTRWDRSSPRAAWVRSPQTPLHQPTPYWIGHATNAYLLGPAPASGAGALRLSFVVRDSVPEWFTIDVDPRSGHTLAMRMTTTSHFMRERYSEFDTPRRIRPPSAD